MREAGSVSGEGGGQGVGGEGEVGYAGLHVYEEVEGGGGGGVVTWWGGLHVRHGCGLSERPSDSLTAGSKTWSLRRGREDITVRHEALVHTRPCVAFRNC